ncbi:MAG: type II toxin-antitoxin system RelE/ParE family toxin [Candidatus Hatepunaea meridiana]|nr:type II toxin-antitoxin system RelE/ParE family toxin [Candidatus Hatepunaea meridiana]
MKYRVTLTDQAQDDLAAIRNPVIREQITGRIDMLKTSPERGKPLRGHLTGYRSLRAARKKYRIIYRTIENKILIIVIPIGQRKGNDFGDIYRSLERLIKRG